MKKYINADLLKSELCNFLAEEDIKSNERYYWEIFDIINSQPAADVEKVVRCKDCKHWSNIEVDYKGEPIKTNNGECQCPQWDNEYYWYVTTENDFCSYGERE